MGLYYFNVNTINDKPCNYIVKVRVTPLYGYQPHAYIHKHKDLIIPVTKAAFPMAFAGRVILRLEESRSGPRPNRNEAI